MCVLTAIFTSSVYYYTISLRWRRIMITVEWLCDVLVCVKYVSCMTGSFIVLRAWHFLTDNSLQSADKDQHESRAVAEKPHNAVVQFDTYRHLQRYHAVLPAIARPKLFGTALVDITQQTRLATCSRNQSHRIVSYRCNQSINQSSNHVYCR